MSEVATAPPQLDKIVEAYIKLRDRKAEMKKEYDAKVEAIDNGLAKLENFLLNTLNAQGVQSIKTAIGTAYKTTKTSATVGNRDEFMEYVRENDAWVLLDVKANKTAVTEYKEQHKALPPGVTWREEVAVNVRR
jgi:hypothetical protein